jgi:hypothetical protein
VKDNRRRAKYVGDFEESCDGVLFEVCNIALVICEAFEDILEGVEFESSKTSFCEFEGLDGGQWQALEGLCGVFTSSWLSCSVVTWCPLSPDWPCPILSKQFKPCGILPKASLGGLLQIIER